MASNKIQDFRSGVEVKCNLDGTVTLGNKKWRFLTSAITANVTTTTDAAGTFASTSNATGRDKIFYSDGTKWQNFSPGSAVADAVADVGALTSATLTDNSAGSANTTVQALPNPTDSPVDADALRDDLVSVLLPALRNNIADLTAQINALRVDVGAVRTKVNAALASLRAAGLMST